MNLASLRPAQAEAPSLGPLGDELRGLGRAAAAEIAAAFDRAGELDLIAGDLALIDPLKLAAAKGNHSDERHLVAADLAVGDLLFAAGGEATVPVSLPPSTLKLKVVSMVVPCRPGICATHLPLMSAARAAAAVTRRANTINHTVRFCIANSSFRIAKLRVLADATLWVTHSKDFLHNHEVTQG